VSGSAAAKADWLRRVLGVTVPMAGEIVGGDDAAPVQDAAAGQAATVVRLTTVLAELTPRIPAAAGNDAARKDALLKFANTAKIQLTTRNLKAAATAIQKLR
jgi:hypothetical protein